MNRETFIAAVDCGRYSLVVIAYRDASSVVCGLHESELTTMTTSNWRVNGTQIVFADIRDSFGVERGVETLIHFLA